MECNICYEKITNKVSLQCSHELCLKCLINIIKKSNKILSCPMCRKNYPEIYLNKSEEQIFEIPNNIPYPYEINILKQDNGQFQTLSLREHEDDLCDFYDIFISHGEQVYQISFIILYTSTE